MEMIKVRSFEVSVEEAVKGFSFFNLKHMVSDYRLTISSHLNDLKSERLLNKT